MKPVLILMGIKVIIREEDLLKDMPVPSILISNHQNNIDLFAASTILPQRTVSVGKSSLLFYPIFGQLFWITGNIVINRSKGSKAIEKLKSLRSRLVSTKTNLWILPEGTRSRGRGLLPFKKGAFITAIESQLPIKPVCFSNYHNKLDWNRWNSGTIIVRPLKTISTVGLKSEDVNELMNKTYENMKTVIEELDKEVDLLVGVK